LPHPASEVLLPAIALALLERDEVGRGLHVGQVGLVRGGLASLAMEVDLVGLEPIL
jgi:hypothetical protein